MEMFQERENKIFTNSIIKLKNMNRIKTQSEIWRLGQLDSIFVEYKFSKYKKEKVNKILEINDKNEMPLIFNDKDSYKSENEEDDEVNIKEKRKSLFKNVSNNPFNLYTKSKSKNGNNSSSNIPAYQTNSIQLEFEEVKFNNYSNENINKETLCEAFFIAGLNFNSGKLIQNSENFIAPCKHKKCSILPSYKSEILKQFVLGDINNNINNNSENIFENKIKKINNKFDLTQATANLCFPQGIKICYHQKESEIKPYNTFTTVTTNESGQRHYLTVFHYYQKMTLLKFKSLFKFDPVTDHNRYNKTIQFLIEKLSDDNSSMNKKEILKCENKLQENHSLCCEFVNCDFVFIPKCICLVAKTPISNYVEKCLETIIKMSIDNHMTHEDINKLLIHLIYEIPFPPNNRKINFYLPYHIHPVEIKGKIYNDLPVNKSNLQILFEFFNIEMILNIFQLILMEQKILFVLDDYRKLSEIIEAFISLIYPLQWINTYIPILSEEMLKYLKSFMPFIMGSDKTLFDFFLNFDDFDEDINVFVVLLTPGKKSTIQSSLNLTKIKRKTNQTNIAMKSIPQIPEFIHKMCVQELENLLKIEKEDLKIIKKSIIEKNNKIEKYNKNHKNFINNSINDSSINSGDNFIYDDEKLNKKIQKVFIKSMVLFFGDYKNYVSFIDDSNYFNAESFISIRDSKNKQFYLDLTQTGIFRHFLNNRHEKEFPYFEKLCVRYNNINCSFNNRISNLKKNKTSNNTDYIRKSFIKSTSKFKSKMSSSTNVQQRKGTAEDIIHSRSINHNRDLNKTPKDFKKSLSNFSFSKSDSKDDSQSKFYEIHETFSIIPFFIQNSMKSVIPYEEMISEKFKYQKEENLEEKFQSRIFEYENQKEFNFENMPKVFRNFILPGKENEILDCIDIMMSNRRNSISDLNDRKSIENIKEIINDFLKMIITADHFIHIDSSTSNSTLTTKYGRNYFSKILFQSKFKENKTQILSQKGFVDLFYMIFNCLVVSENESQSFEDVMRVTKSTFFYYRLHKNKDHYYIYQELVRKNPNPFSIWLNEEFWLFWFELEIKEKLNSFQIIDDFYFYVLSEMSALMINLNIDVKVILDCIVEKIAKTYIQNDVKLLEDLEKTINKQNLYLAKSKEF